MPLRVISYQVLIRVWLLRRNFSALQSPEAAAGGERCGPGGAAAGPSGRGGGVLAQEGGPCGEWGCRPRGSQLPGSAQSRACYGPLVLNTRKGRCRACQGQPWRFWPGAGRGGRRVGGVCRAARSWPRPSVGSVTVGSSPRGRLPRTHCRPGWCRGACPRLFSRVVPPLAAQGWVRRAPRWVRSASCGLAHLAARQRRVRVGAPGRAVVKRLCPQLPCVLVARDRLVCS